VAQAPDMAKRKVCLGMIAGAHGVRGDVRVQSFTADPADIVAYGPLTDEAGTRKLSLKLVGETRGQLIARIAGVADRNAAEALKGLRLYVERSALPATAAEEYYHGDLLGLRCELRDGEAYGTVAALHDFGAGDVIEIERPGGERVMLPFTSAVVPVVDLAGGRLVVEPPVEVVAEENAGVEAPAEEQHA
jgi:16S rRNA processing protein RimM